MSDLERFRTEHPEWADLPDERIEKSTSYAWWSFGEESRRLMSEVGDAFKDLARRFR